MVSLTPLSLASFMASSSVHSVASHTPEPGWLVELTVKAFAWAGLARSTPAKSTSARAAIRSAAHTLRRFLASLMPIFPSLENWKGESLHRPAWCAGYLHQYHARYLG
jgi:hypothetical protein